MFPTSVQRNRPLSALGPLPAEEVAPPGGDLRRFGAREAAEVHQFRVLSIATAAGIDLPLRSVDFSGLFDVLWPLLSDNSDEAALW